MAGTDRWNRKTRVWRLAPEGIALLVTGARSRPLDHYAGRSPAFYMGFKSGRLKPGRTGARRFSFEQMNGKEMGGALCYRKPFEPNVKKRYNEIVKKLFDHPMWVKEAKQDQIAKSNDDATVGKIFESEGLDYIYLTKL